MVTNIKRNEWICCIAGLQLEMNAKITTEYVTVNEKRKKPNWRNRKLRKNIFFFIFFNLQQSLVKVLLLFRSSNNEHRYTECTTFDDNPSGAATVCMREKWIVCFLVSIIIWSDKNRFWIRKKQKKRFSFFFCPMYFWFSDVSFRFKF